jgi:general secretion pathway protein B
MSYILDALKKSEEERQRGEIPGLQTVQTNPVSKPHRRSYWPYVLMTALLLNAGFVLWWLRPWQSDKAPHAVPAAPPAELAQKAERPAETPASSVEPTPVAAGDPSPKSDNQGDPPKAAAEEPVRTAAVAPQQEVSSDRPLPKPETMSPGAADTAASKTDAPVHTPRASVTTPPPVKKENPLPAAGPLGVRDANLKSPEETPKGLSSSNAAVPVPAAGIEKRRGKQAKDKAPAISSRFDPEAPSPAEYPKEILEALLNSKDTTPPAQSRPAPPPPSTPAPLPSGEKSTKAGVPALKDLPLDVQMKVPKMSFSVFVYAQKPADRMVIIDGSTRREGDEVSSGLRLEEITRDGAIFSFKGHRFLQRVF